MLLEKNVVGKKTDWANYITLSDEHETPLLNRLPKGEKPVNVVKHYQADTYAAPKKNAQPEGKAWDNFKSAGSERKELQARVQYLFRGASVGKLAQDVTDTAGVQDELAREITKQMTVLARDMECHAASNQGSYADDGTTGHMYRGVGKWVQTAAQSDADSDVPASIRPNTNQIYGGTKANFVENSLKAILQQMWQSTGTKAKNLVLFGGQSIMAQIAENFQFYVPSSAATQSTSRVTHRDNGESVLGSNISMYQSSFGKVELVPTKWNSFNGFGSVTTDTVSDWTAYILHPDMWAWHWNQKPTVYQPEYKGGSYTSAIEAIIMLLCLNPIGEGKILPSDA